eukprot:2288127-Rhodomonas_salina.3
MFEADGLRPFLVGKEAAGEPISCLCTFGNLVVTGIFILCTGFPLCWPPRPEISPTHFPGRNYRTVTGRVVVWDLSKEPSPPDNPTPAVVLVEGAGEPVRCCPSLPLSLLNSLPPSLPPEIYSSHRSTPTLPGFKSKTPFMRPLRTAFVVSWFDFARLRHRLRLWEWWAGEFTAPSLPSAPSAGQPVRKEERKVGGLGVWEEVWGVARKRKSE